MLSSEHFCTYNSQDQEQLLVGVKWSGDSVSMSVFIECLLCVCKVPVLGTDPSHFFKFMLYLMWLLNSSNKTKATLTFHWFPCSRIIITTANTFHRTHETLSPTAIRSDKINRWEIFHWTVLSLWIGSLLQCLAEKLSVPFT